MFVLSVCLLMQTRSVHAKAVAWLLWAPTGQTWGHPDVGAFTCRTTTLLWALCQGMHWNCYKQISFQHYMHALSACHQYRLCQKKLYNFHIFIAEKVNKARQQHFDGQKHNFHVCKKIFKWYHSMVRCKSYGPLGDEW